MASRVAPLLDEGGIAWNAIGTTPPSDKGAILRRPVSRSTPAPFDLKIEVGSAYLTTWSTATPSVTRATPNVPRAA